MGVWKCQFYNILKHVKTIILCVQKNNCEFPCVIVLNSLTSLFKVHNFAFYQQDYNKEYTVW